MYHWTGVVPHQPANPDPAFDPSARIPSARTAALVTSVVGANPVEASA
ncbi:hypothetical protein [Actinomadura sp. KC216]|nr:hypothetical protein [Actinomadura sp. KC216]